MKNKSLLHSLALASLPIISFLLQYFFSASNGTLYQMLHHYNVSIVDFIFIPFNIIIVKSINWKNGMRIFYLFLLAFALSCFVHYGWAVNQTDTGHMIASTGFITLSGWVHIIFSAVEFFLMLSFVFNFSSFSKHNLTWNTIFIEAYLILSLIGGYFIHMEFLMEDIIRIASGTILFLIYYIFRLKNWSKNYESN